jgi:hypothetical protein
MTLEEFRNSLSQDVPPIGLNDPLKGLWWDAKGDWPKAHESAQEDESPGGAWVHAYLHRKEGYSANAGYWYHRAGKPAFNGALEAEWQHIVQRLLSA